MFSGSSAPKKFDPLALAFDLEERGHAAEAERHYLNILQTQPKEWRALHQLGAICMARGDLPEALRFMGAAMKAKPSAAEAKSNYGLILQKLGSTKKRSFISSALWMHALAMSPPCSIAERACST